MFAYTNSPCHQRFVNEKYTQETTLWLFTQTYKTILQSLKLTQKFVIIYIYRQTYLLIQSFLLELENAMKLNEY